MNELTTISDNFPIDPLELSRSMQLSKEILDSCRANLNFLRESGHYDEFRLFLGRAQRAAIRLLEIQTKIGEMSYVITQGYKKTDIIRDQAGRIITSKNHKSETPEKWKRLGLKSIQQLRLCQCVYNNPDLVLLEINEAKKNEGLPTAASIRTRYNNRLKSKQSKQSVSKQDEILSNLKMMHIDMLNMKNEFSKEKTREIKKVLEQMNEVINTIHDMYEWKSNETKIPRQL